MKLKINRLKELDIKKHKEFKIRDGLSIPFLFDIAKLTDDVQTITSDLDYFSSDIKFEKSIEVYLDVFREVNLELLEFEEMFDNYNFIKNSKGLYIFNDVRSFAIFFIRNFSTQSILQNLKAFVYSSRNEIFRSYENKLYELLELNNKNDNLTIEYMDLRILENSPVAYFDENKNRSPHNYSIREVLLRRAYNTRTNQLDIRKQQRQNEEIAKIRNKGGD